MAFLLQARFNSTGPTSSDIKNLGGVSFTETSPCRDGSRCAYFYPLDDRGGLEVIGNTRLKLAKALSEENNSFTFYCKYKIDKTMLSPDQLIPILSYIDDTGTNIDLICIEEANKFDLCYSAGLAHFTEDISYTFDNQWHTLVMERNSTYSRIFVDGFLQLVFYDDAIIPIKNTTHIYIGYRDTIGTGDHTSNFCGGYLDDICIVDDAVYTDNFFPPNMYWMGKDCKANYSLAFRKNPPEEWNKVFNIDQMPGYLIDQTEKNMEHSAFRINETQKTWLPRRLRITWHEEDGYFRNQTWLHVLDKNKHYTVIQITGLEQPLLMETENPEFVDYFIAEEALEKKQIYAFMLFVDKTFVKLSDIVILKSNNYYTLFIDNREQDPYQMIQSVELVLIPFPVIYEEGLGEREDIRPIYVFDEKGKFNPSNGYTYYYIDPDAGSDMYSTGIIEQNIKTDLQKHKESDSSNSGDKNSEGDYDDSKTDKESDYLHSYWRYGTFTKLAEYSTYYRVKFNSSDNTVQAKQGDTINLFKNTLNMDTRVYEIVGTDTFNINKYALVDNDLFNRNITMQIITDKRSPNYNQFRSDFIEMKEVTIKATKDHQMRFTIPTVLAKDGKPFRNYIIFKEGYSMLGVNRIKVIDNTTLLILDYSDFLMKGDTLTFVFLKCNKADQFGPLHVKPIYLWTRTNAIGKDYTTEVKIPKYHNLSYNINNIIMFVNGTFVSPDRYTVENGFVKLKDTTYDRWINDKDVTFILLKMTSESEDPTNKKDKIVKYQEDQGSRFVLYDLNNSDDCGDEDAWAKGALTKWNKITLDNFTVFDQNGEYLPEIIGEVYNMNVIKYIKNSIDPLVRVPRYLVCIYSPKSLKNKANIVIPDNCKFIKDFIRLYQEFPEMEHWYWEHIFPYQKMI